MVRPEATTDQLIVSCLDQFEGAGEWKGTMRIKWIINSTATTQTDEDQLVRLIVREKNKTL